MGGAGRQTGPIVQGGLGGQAGIAVIAVRPVTQSAVGVAMQTLSLLNVLKEPLRAVLHAEALVKKMILLTACRRDSFWTKQRQKIITTQWN